MNYRAILLLILIGFLLVPVVSAANPNYTSTFNTTGSVVVVNQSYHIYDQNATAYPEWLFEVVLGLVLFFASLYASTKPEMSEIDGILSVMSMLPMFVAAFTATSIDYVTGYGVTSTLIGTVQYYVLLENHTIYHYDITGIVLWIFSMIATLNTIRIVVNHRKFDRMFKEEGGKT